MPLALSNSPLILFHFIIPYCQLSHSTAICQFHLLCVFDFRKVIFFYLSHFYISCVCCLDRVYSAKENIQHLKYVYSFPFFWTYISFQSLHLLIVNYVNEWFIFYYLPSTNEETQSNLPTQSSHASTGRCRQPYPFRQVSPPHIVGEGGWDRGRIPCLGSSPSGVRNLGAWFSGDWWFIHLLSKLFLNTIVF